MNTSDQIYLCVFRHHVDTQKGWGVSRPNVGCVLIDFTDSPGSGPLGNAFEIEQRIEAELGLSRVELTVLVHQPDQSVAPQFIDTICWRAASVLIVDDEEVDPDTIKLIVIDTTKAN